MVPLAVPPSPDLGKSMSIIASGICDTLASNSVAPAPNSPETFARPASKFERRLLDSPAFALPRQYSRTTRRSGLRSIVPEPTSSIRSVLMRASVCRSKARPREPTNEAVTLPFPPRSFDTCSKPGKLYSLIGEALPG